jgi:hypothetical protein
MKQRWQTDTYPRDADSRFHKNSVHEPSRSHNTRRSQNDAKRCDAYRHDVDSKLKKAYMGPVKSQDKTPPSVATPTQYFIKRVPMPVVATPT